MSAVDVEQGVPTHDSVAMFGKLKVFDAGLYPYGSRIAGPRKLEEFRRLIHTREAMTASENVFAHRAARSASQIENVRRRGQATEEGFQIRLFLAKKRAAGCIPGPGDGVVAVS